MSEKADPILLRVMLSGDDFERAGDFVKAARAHPVGSIEIRGAPPQRDPVLRTALLRQRAQETQIAG
jgi:hypothetical protein